jgi:hypothetical protein
MARRRLALRVGLAAAVLAAAGATWLLVGRARGGRTDGGGPAVARRFVLPDRATRTFRFDLETRLEIDLQWLARSRGTAAVALTNTGGAPASAPGAVGAWTVTRAQAHGEVQLRFFHEKPGWYTGVGILRDVDYRLNGRPADLRDATEHPFMFRMSELGYVSALRFVRGVADHAAGLERALLAAMQVGLPREAKRAWKTYEVDGLGRYRAEYSLGPAPGGATELLTKRPVEYVAVKLDGLDIETAPRRGPGAAPAHGVAGTQVELQGCATRVTLPRTSDLPLDWDGQGSQRLRHGAREWARSSSRFSARRVEAAASERLPTTVAAAEAQLASLELLRSTYYRPDPALAGAPTYASLSEAVAAFRALWRSKDMAARLRAEALLVDYLRRNRGAAAELVALLDGSTKESLDPSTQLVLWRLIAKAGHAEAQRAVLDALTDPSRSVLTRSRALAYSQDFETPEPFLIEGLWRASEALGGGGAGGDRSLRSMALLALGALGSKENQDPGAGGDVGRRLAAGLAAATTTADQINFLDAIGNLGRVELLDAVTPFLASPDVNVRVHAVTALRRMPGTAPEELLLRHYASETAPEVRAAVVGVLAGRETTPPALAWAAGELLRADDRRLQLALVQLVGGALPRYPAGEAALRQLLARDVAVEVKQAIYRYVAPTPQ